MLIKLSWVHWKQKRCHVDWPQYVILSSSRCPQIICTFGPEETSCWSHCPTWTRPSPSPCSCRPIRMFQSVYKNTFRRTKDTWYLLLISYNDIQETSDLVAFFEDYFPDAVPLIGKERLEQDYFAGKPLPLISVKVRTAWVTKIEPDSFGYKSKSNYSSKRYVTLRHWPTHW